jgi:predicted enzyme related to lactoylglutathione lyase
MSENNECQGPKAGDFSWNELVTTEPKGAEAFYTKLFGWQTRPFKPEGLPPGAPPYTVFFTDPNSMGVGGMLAVPAGAAHSHWQAYVIVKSVDATLAQAVKLGGKVLMPGMDIPEVGRTALIQDPQGAIIGLHQPPV